MRDVRKLLRPLLDMLYPPGRSCLACGEAVFGTALCPDCAAGLKRARLPRDACPRCAMPRSQCTCAGTDPIWDAAGAAFAYEGQAKALVLDLKFQAVEGCADLLAAAMAERLTCLDMPPPDLITWPAMPRARRRERGIDHARLLAEKLGERLSIPAAQLLDRAATPQAEQHTLDKQGRILAAKHAFVPRDGVKLPPGTHVLLVDDVMTTGETCRRCAALLRGMGAARITVLCAARTMGKSSSMIAQGDKRPPKMT